MSNDELNLIFTTTKENKIINDFINRPFEDFDSELIVDMVKIVKRLDWVIDRAYDVLKSHKADTGVILDMIGRGFK